MSHLPDDSSKIVHTTQGDGAQICLAPKIPCTTHSQQLSMLTRALCTVCILGQAVCVTTHMSYTCTATHGTDNRSFKPAGSKPNLKHAHITCIFTRCMMYKVHNVN